jgi:hypothetical protein
MPASRLGPIRVTGSVSGPHAGTVRGDSDGRGGSFLPAKPFVNGETVTVTTDLNVVGGSSGTFHFGVAMPGGTIPIQHRPAPRRVHGDVHRYRSAPGLIPAAVRIAHHGRSAPGLIFLSAHAGPVQQGPMIIDGHGGVVWFKPLPHRQSATDVRVQRYHGQPVLTWWQGDINASGIGQGEGVIDDSSYQTVATVHAGNGLLEDLHEFQLTSQGTALITAFHPVFVNASGLPRGTTHTLVFDSVVQEIDIPTGLVLFQWDSLDHVPLRDTHSHVPIKRHPFDYFHVNSIQQDRDGNLVVSSRNTWAAYKVNHNTGRVMWTLGGKRSSFRLGHGARFAYQHDVRVHGKHDGRVTIFDDGGGLPRIRRQSRGLTLRLDFRHRRATVARQTEHRPPIAANYEGSVQQLPFGDEMVGWGQRPYFSEFNAGGKVVLDAHFVGQNSCYRTYKFRWTGRPSSPPALAARQGRRTTTYVSWNGSTLVRRWRILVGRSPRSLHTATVRRVVGFETRIRVKRARYVEAQALNAKGTMLGKSRVVQVH